MSKQAVSYPDIIIEKEEEFEASCVVEKKDVKEPIGDGQQKLIKLSK